MSKIAAKYSESHDRLTVNIKFPDGANIRLTESRGGSRVSGKGIPQALFEEFCTRIARLKDENLAPVDRCKQMVAAVEGHATIEEVLAAYGKPAAPTVAAPAPVVVKPVGGVTGLCSPSSNNEEIAKAVLRLAGTNAANAGRPVKYDDVREVLAGYVAHHKLSERRNAGIKAKIVALGYMI